MPPNHLFRTKPAVARPALRFLFSWTWQHAFIFVKALFVGAVAIAVLNATVLRLQMSVTVEVLVICATVGGLVGMLIGETQQKVLRRFRVWDAEGWRTVSALGGVMGGVLLFLVVNNSGNLHQLYFGIRSVVVPRGRFASPMPSWWLMPAYMMALAFAQWMFLRRFVARAWLWWLACVLGAMMFSQFALTSSLARQEGMAYLLHVGVIVSVQGFVMGCTWLVMWSSQSSETQTVAVPVRANPNERSVWDDAI